MLTLYSSINPFLIHLQLVILVVTAGNVNMDNPYGPGLATTLEMVQ